MATPAEIVRLRYRVRNVGDSDSDGDVPTVVFIHGVGSDSGVWEEVLDGLPINVRAVSYDLRSHGESSRVAGEYQLDDFVDDHLTLMEQIGLDRYHLVGCSLGGLIAQAVSLRVPESVLSLVLISSIAGRTESQRNAVRSRLQDLENLGLQGMAAKSADRWYTRAFARARPECVNRRLEAFQKNDFHGYLASYRVLANNDLGKQLKQISCPTLAVTGQEDMGSPPVMSDFMARQIPQGRSVIVPAQRHAMLQEVPLLIAQLVGDFIHECGMNPNEVREAGVFQQGLNVRRAVLGTRYVNEALAAASEGDMDFQDFITRYCWWEVWGDRTLSRRERSLIVLAITGALGRLSEFTIHTRGAYNNGLSREELDSLVKQIAVYAGVPAGVSAAHILRSMPDSDPQDT